MANTVHVLDIPFSRMSMDETATLINTWLDEEEEAQKPRWVVTANPEIVMFARGHSYEAAELREGLAAADLITPDGIGIVLAMRLQGHPARERVTGADLTPKVLEYCSARGYRVFLLGSSRFNNHKAIVNLQHQYPNVVFAGHDGFFTENEVAAVLEQIRTFKPHLLLVGLGSPKQEQFIARYREFLGVPVSIGIGGVIDIFAGVVARAPEMWIRMRLEWLYRLLSQPSRWRRQLALPKFAWLIFKRRFLKSSL